MTEILWLTPQKPSNISTGRRRIVEGLENRGYTVIHTMERTDCLKRLWRDPDLLITSTAAGGIVGPVASALNIPYLVDYVDPITQMRESSTYLNARSAEVLQDIAFRCADGILYVYTEEATRVQKYTDPITETMDQLTLATASKEYTTPIQKTTLGVDFDRFNEPDERVIERAEERLYSEGIEPGFAVYIGGLEPIYNVETMLQAAELTPVNLVIAGTGSQRQLVREHSRQSQSIHYIDVIPHEIVPGVLAKAGVGICLVDDPHTVKVLEYAASGLPTVQLEGRAERELPNDTCFTSGKPGQIARAMERASEVELSESIQYAREHDYQNVIGDYESMIQKLL